MQVSHGNGRRHPAAHRWLVLAAGLVPLAAAQAAGDATPGLFGFTAPEAATQRALEQRFDGALNPADLRGWLQKLSSAPNQVGSPARQGERRVRPRPLQAVGLAGTDRGIRGALSDLEAAQPRARGTEPLHGEPQRATGRGRCDLGGPPTIMPPYNVYGADGDVTGELVYVNYGMPKDYKDLARRGIDVKGKIVITRYGGGWRGLKPKLAQEHGAIGCLIYSDPRDDGYAQGDVYPKGGWRPPEGVQRGSVLDMTLYSGDPLTPGVGATRDAKRLALADAKTILKIPVMPISYARRTAVARRARRPGGARPLAWRAADHLSHRTGTRAGAPGDQLRLGFEAPLRRHREDPGAREPE